MLEFLYGLGWLAVICGSGYGLWWFRFGRHERATKLRPVGHTPSFNSPPPQDKPATTRPDGAIPARSVEAAGSAAPVDTRTATLVALSGVPAEVKLHAPHGLHLNVFRDATGWRPLDLAAEKMYGVFGTTGSGKGYLLQAMALQVLALGPEVAQLVVIDGKDGLDYGFCHQIEHATLFMGDELSDGIAYVTAERKRRNELLKSVGARNVEEYSRKLPALPYLFVIVDELKAFSKPQLEDLARNALMIRASGGRMVFGTQYPTVDTIPSSIQAVITDRFVGRLVSAEHSGVALRRRAKVDPETFEPSVIPQSMPGVMVCRTDGGQEYLGRTPNVDDMTRELWIAALADRWPKVSSKSPPFNSPSRNNEATDDADQQMIPITDTASADEDLTLGIDGITPGIGYPVAVGYRRDNRLVTVEMSEMQAAAIEKWLTMDRLSANQIAPKLRPIAHGAALAMVAHVKQQLAARQVEA